jgi:hypothetical protein
MFSSNVIALGVHDTWCDGEDALKRRDNKQFTSDLFERVTRILQPDRLCISEWQNNGVKSVAKVKTTVCNRGIKLGGQSPGQTLTPTDIGEMIGVKEMPKSATLS